LGGVIDKEVDGWCKEIDHALGISDDDDDDDDCDDED
jgi:hypothetical protein